MRAVALDYRSHSLDRIDVPEPDALRPGEVLFRMAAVGVCGTDRELARFRFGRPPDGEDRLILGHEAVGQVIASESADFRPGEWVAPMVRRPCSPACRSCARERVDLCLSGAYTEHGITGAHGYFRDLAAEQSRYLVRVRPEVVDVAVLAEPLSVVEKAVEMALRLHADEPRRALVIGAGTVGILAALLLQDAGLETVIYSAEQMDSRRATLVRSGGLEYTDAVPARGADVVIEAAGASEAASAGLSMLEPLGVLVVLGAHRWAQDAPLIDLIVGNRIVAGSVNAGPGHWDLALDHLARFDRQFLDRLVHRMPFDAFRDSITRHASEAPKIVHPFE